MSTKPEEVHRLYSELTEEDHLLVKSAEELEKQLQRVVMDRLKEHEHSEVNNIKIQMAIVMSAISTFVGWFVSANILAINKAKKSLGEEQLSKPEQEKSARGMVAQISQGASGYSMLSLGLASLTESIREANDERH